MKGLLRSFVLQIVVLNSICALFVAYSYAQPVVIGERIEFSPSNPRPGQTVFMGIRFRVEGSGPRVPMDISVVEGTGTPDPAHPILSGGTFAPSSSPYTLNIGYRIPDRVPPRLCFNIYAHFPRTALRSTLLFHNACLGARLYLTSSGTAQRVMFVEGVPAGSPPGTPPGLSSTVEIRGIEFNPLNISLGKNLITIRPNIHREGDPMFLEVHLIRGTKDVASTTVSLRLVDNRSELVDRVFWSEDNRVPSHLSYDIYGRKPSPVRIDREPGSTPTGPPPPLQRLVSNLELETRMYVVSAGTGQRITLPSPSKAKAPLSPAVKQLRPDINRD
jgi:hypothetical protein